MSRHQQAIKFVPLESGQMRIKGCVIKFSACKPTEFHIYGERTRREKELWHDARGGEGKIKGVGAIESASDESDMDGFRPRRVLNITVLPPQPLLVIEGSSVQDDSIMLLEGERHIFLIGPSLIAGVRYTFVYETYLTRLSIGSTFLSMTQRSLSWKKP